MIKTLLFTFVFFYLINNSWSKSFVNSNEVHKFHVTVHAAYRCYSGYDGKKLTDDRSKEVCNNKTTDSQILDKNITVIITDEPDPEDSKDLAGSWLEEVNFKGRKFVIALSLFKNISSKNYRFRISAKDDEPVARETVLFAEMKNVSAMNNLVVEYTSKGKKEEISYTTQVFPSVRK